MMNASGIRLSGKTLLSLPAISVQMAVLQISTMGRFICKYILVGSDEVVKLHDNSNHRMFVFFIVILDCVICDPFIENDYCIHPTIQYGYRSIILFPLIPNQLPSHIYVTRKLD